MNKLVIPLAILVIIVVGALVWSQQGVKNGGEATVTRLVPEGQPVRVAIINYLPGILDGPIRGLKKGMTDLGYEEGKDIMYTQYEAVGNFDKMVADAKDVIQNNKADVIVGNPGEGAQAALKAAQELGNTVFPILYMLSFDPLAMKLINSFQSSGNQVTGVAVDLSYLTGRRLEFLRQMAPNAKKLGIIVGVSVLDITAQKGLDEVLKQAPALGFEIKRYDTKAFPGPSGDADVAKIAESIKPGEIDAFYRMLGPVTSSPGTIAAYAKMGERLKIPTEFFGHEPGSLFNYDNDYDDSGIQLATLLDKVIKGVKPTDIPSENARKFLFRLDDGVAKRIGITVPEALRSIATEVIPAK
ncbi:hypothetical protein A3D66_01045 [Candidatus Kaiserbacteria bacterium RIFCSPHIGHO2_02_FULL_50_9]|uniref:ABC transporter substrate-binding protein n=1 Tax=Candidatus Kaiserbacteria bacterium RIFCSPLOWO2_01_FULL_51_21 TaxID=1798508 RepID=A0A1F6ECY7_9BACT|nr:MAG: hypothetical protein A2761_01840 [Candidatus Kaiserbacteria bacterium RIFCSPHIGHO2_01_FULL_51_33]OGG63240.1 MAG: hypothetical protein A3D66_01045 [Candidatus Kaiserbacteria bacterium RIFCSPHIGHO2_02_FULL_50_9]OGG71544.1 MAG: hypothetical protein A3A35_00140 [Candidatus Kaiserbacteria bacterium RIFCSPLOWO2_01_FULL_51_21]